MYISIYTNLLAVVPEMQTIQISLPLERPRDAGPWMRIGAQLHHFPNREVHKLWVHFGNRADFIILQLPAGAFPLLIRVWQACGCSSVKGRVPFDEEEQNNNKKNKKTGDAGLDSSTR